MLDSKLRAIDAVLEQGEETCDLQYKGVADPVAFKDAMLKACFHMHYKTLKGANEGIGEENMKKLTGHLAMMKDNIDNPMQKSLERHKQYIRTKQEESQKLKDVSEKIRSEESKKDDNKLTQEEKNLSRPQPKDFHASRSLRVKLVGGSNFQKRPENSRVLSPQKGRFLEGKWDPGYFRKIQVGEISLAVVSP